MIFLPIRGFMRMVVDSGEADETRLTMTILAFMPALWYPQKPLFYSAKQANPGTKSRLLP
jgi:hypothetical protein